MHIPHHYPLTAILTAFLVLGSFPAHGQVQGSGGIPAGPGVLYPGLEATGFYNDNLLFQPDNAVSTFGIRAVPSARYEAGNAIRRYILDWALDVGIHEASPEDDYVDQRLVLGLEYQPTTRFFSSLEGVYIDSHDPRGTGRAEGTSMPLLPEPDRWHSMGVEGGLAYGAEEAKGRMEFDAGFIKKTYDNNRIFTIVRDRGDLYGAGRFIYRLGARSSLVAEARATRYGYTHHIPGVPGLNSSVYRALAGFSWDISEKTTGSAKAAYIIKDFVSRLREDSGAAGWEVNLEWRPRTYSILNFSTARDFQETNGAGDFIQRDDINVTWEHYWLERFSSEVGFSYARNRFEPIPREDEVIGGRLRFSYLMRRWLTFGAGYQYGERSSTDDAFDYAANRFEVMMRIAL